MTKEELKEKFQVIESDYWSAKRNAAREYALSNNTYKVGDIFTDHIGSILIEKIGIYFDFYSPCCTYTGLELKKDGTPTKGQSKRQAYQMNELKNTLA